jgi:hypothetical protein
MDPMLLLVSMLYLHVQPCYGTMLCFGQHKVWHVLYFVFVYNASDLI